MKELSRVDDRYLIKLKERKGNKELPIKTTYILGLKYKKKTLKF